MESSQSQGFDTGISIIAFKCVAHVESEESTYGPKVIVYTTTNRMIAIRGAQQYKFLEAYRQWLGITSPPPSPPIGFIPPQS